MYKMDEEEEEEARTKYCKAMISRVRDKLQSPEEDRRRLKSGRGGTRTLRQVAAGAEFRGHGERNVPPPDGTAHQKDLRQGPEDRPVPLQLITMLRLQTFKERTRRVAEVERHDPAVCAECQREQASLALDTFIRRKKTQLQFPTLKGRLNTHWRDRL